MAASSVRAKIGGILGRLCGCVMITETSLMELGIPSKAIRDSEPSSAIVWVDARRLRRHMRKYNSYAQRQKRAAFWFNKLPAGSCAVGTAPGFWSVSWGGWPTERYRK